MSEMGQAIKVIKKSLIEQIAEKVAEIASLKAKLKMMSDELVKTKIELIDLKPKLESEQKEYDSLAALFRLQTKKLEAKDEVIRGARESLEIITNTNWDDSWEMLKAYEKCKEVLSQIDALMKKG